MHYVLVPLLCQAERWTMNCCSVGCPPNGKLLFKPRQPLPGYESRVANSFQIARIKFNGNWVSLYTIQWRKLILITECYENRSENRFSNSRRICRPGESRTIYISKIDGVNLDNTRFGVQRSKVNYQIINMHCEQQFLVFVYRWFYIIRW